MLSHRSSNGPGWRTCTTPARPALRSVRVWASRTCLLTATGGCVTAVGRPATPTLKPPVKRLWRSIQQQLAYLTQYGTAGSSASKSDLEELDNIYCMEVSEPHLLAWHVLPLLRPYLQDVGGPVPTAYVMRFASHRAAQYGDYSPLVWALGLQQPVAPGTSSPLPPPPDPPLSADAARPLLAKTVYVVVRKPVGRGACSELQHLACIKSIVQQLQQQRPALLEDPKLPLQLWRLCCAAQAPDTFWQMVQANPELQQGVCSSMVQEVALEEVASLAEGLVRLGLLVRCSVEDIWWLVARLDNAAGDKDSVLQVFGILAAVSPHHPALEPLGEVLLKYLSNGRSTGTLKSNPNARPYALTHSVPGTRRCYYAAMAQALRSPEAGRLDEVSSRFIPHFTCSMGSAEVVDWLTRLQLVLSPQQACGLLSQLLQGPLPPRALHKADLVRLYDLLLKQLGRRGWAKSAPWHQFAEQRVLEQRQQVGAGVLPPAAADVVLCALPDASKTRAAAAKGLVVWRHMFGAVDPNWCEDGLASVAHGARVFAEGPGALKNALRSPSTGDTRSTPALRDQQLQQLSAKGQQQVKAALERFELQVESS